VISSWRLPTEPAWEWGIWCRTKKYPLRTEVFVKCRCVLLGGIIDRSYARDCTIRPSQTDMSTSGHIRQDHARMLRTSTRPLCGTVSYNMHLKTSPVSLASPTILSTSHADHEARITDKLGSQVEHRTYHIESASALVGKPAFSSSASLRCSSTSSRRETAMNLDRAG
jgi:hypothetical protein